MSDVTPVEGEEPFEISVQDLLLEYQQQISNLSAQLATARAQIRTMMRQQSAPPEAPDKG